MCCWSHAEIMLEDPVDVYGPQSWSLWVTLHVAEDRNNIAWGDEYVTKTNAPPVMKCRVRPNVVLLCWIRSLSKRVTSVSTSNDVVVERCVGVKQACGVIVHI